MRLVGTAPHPARRDTPANLYSKHRIKGGAGKLEDHFVLSWLDLADSVLRSSLWFYRQVL